MKISNGVKKSRYISFFIVVLVLAGGFVLMRYGFPGNTADSTLAGMQTTVYKSPSCGCCGNYIGYMERRGVDVETKNVSDIERVKNDNEIPEDMKSCHTSLIGDYVVEGHIPLEAIEKLLAEKPDIRGIAMPGMPSGSPGMPGAKTGPFEIYSLNHDGSTELFMSL